MRFSDDGPDIPNELLVARDQGDVVFFCGAGVSLARANLPDFVGLADQVITELGAAQNSPARNSDLAVDRRFRLLEREFEGQEVRDAVAARLRVDAAVDLTSHRTLLDLATSRGGVVRLVTTNFDGLFERADPNLPSSAPPRLPDPHNDLDFRGVVHIHGRTDADDGVPPELVLSSADFGRAYLSDGWATRFIRRLLERFQVVFIGYSAEDPPVQYLLEALDLPAGGRKKLYTFEDAANGDAIGLWEHKGVEAIPYGGGYVALWDTLEHWARRARDPDAWVRDLLATAAQGPAKLAPYQRGQVAHVVGTQAGAQRVVTADPPLPPAWLNVFDPTCRYATPEARYHEPEAPRFDPFSAFSLDSDITPPPADPSNFFQRREVPLGAWDGFATTRPDRTDPVTQSVAGEAADRPLALPQRLRSLGVWIRNIAPQPGTLAWAARRGGLHPDIESGIEWKIRTQPAQFSPAMREGWRAFFRASHGGPMDVNRVEYELRGRVQTDGWSAPLVRRWAEMFRPRLTATAATEVGREPSEPLERLGDVLRLDVGYPRPHESRPPTDAFVAYAVECFRINLSLAIALEHEVRGRGGLYLTTSRAGDGGLVDEDAFGVTGVLATFQRLFQRLTLIDRERARVEAAGWPADDEHLYGRLRLWAAGLPELMSGDEAAVLFLALSEEMFWGTNHQRDLLFGLRDRWANMSEGAQRELEQRLLTGTYPYSGEMDEPQRARFAAYDQLNRITWLAQEGIRFSFDVETEIAQRRLIDTEWEPEAAMEAAASNAAEVFRIATDTDPALLANLPIKNILAAAQDVGQHRIRDRVHREPFAGLCAADPVRALAALTLAGKAGAAPERAWGDFLRSEARTDDSERMFATVAQRLVRLPAVQRLAIAYPISEWMRANAARLYAAPELADGLWMAMIEALRSDPTEARERCPRQAWADEGLNAPVGHLFQFLMADPAKADLAAGRGLPEHWTGRLEELMGLPGDHAGQAMVMSAFQLTWLFYVDPDWTTAHLIPALNPASPLGTPFWEGFLWAARAPSPDLLVHMKEPLLRRAMIADSARRHDRILGGILLDAWGRALDPDHTGASVAPTELREVLIHADDDLRRHVLWTLSSWAKGQDSVWTARVAPFLRDVWPKQRALKTPAMSARLADLVLSLPDQFAELVPIVVPRLVPLRRYESQLDGLGETDEKQLVERHALEVLDLLWALLGDDAEGWPYGVGPVLERLSRQAAVERDTRMAELRRRLQG